MEKVKYGILSTASIVPRFVKGMRLTENGEVLAIASRSQEKAASWANDLDIPLAYGSVDELLANPDITAVYIAVINSMHYEYAKRALEAGKHVLLEKPFVLHASQARELKDLARAQNLFLTEAVKTPHLPIYAEIRKILASEELGKLCFMEFRQSYNSGPYTGGWNTDKTMGGGVLYGNEAYFFTMAQYLAGPVLSCQGCAVFPVGEAESQIAVNALFGDGVIANLCVSREVLFENGLKLHFSEGRIEVPDYWKADKAVVYENGEPDRELSFPHESEFFYQLNHYNQCILSGFTESPVTPLETTIRNTELTEEICRSWALE